MIDAYGWIRTALTPVLRAAQGGPQRLDFHLTSPDIKAGGTVPMMHVYQGNGCTGQNISPALEWHNLPPGTGSIAVTCYDPDAPTGSGWWHWVVYDIPFRANGLPRGAGNAGGDLPQGAMQGRNDYGETGYGGPCPPPGDKPHRYVFTAYAVKVGRLELPRDPSCAMIGFMINANKLAEGSFTASFGR
jgi:Raf kinase inhibitor-like YbhB/YbcL family protein